MTPALNTITMKIFQIIFVNLLFSSLYASIISFNGGGFLVQLIVCSVFALLFAGSIILVKILLNIHKNNSSLIIKHSSVIIPLIAIVNQLDLENLILRILIPSTMFLFIYFTSTKNNLEKTDKFTKKLFYYFKLNFILPICIFFFLYALFRLLGGVAIGITYQ